MTPPATVDMVIEDEQGGRIMHLEPVLIFITKCMLRRLQDYATARKESTLYAINRIARKGYIWLQEDTELAETISRLPEWRHERVIKSCISLIVYPYPENWEWHPLNLKLTTEQLKVAKADIRPEETVRILISLGFLADELDDSGTRITPPYKEENRLTKYNDTYTYAFWTGSRMGYVGITNDIEGLNRELEESNNNGEFFLQQVGGAISKDLALEWLDEQRKLGRPIGPDTDNLTPELMRA